jgi:cysteine synthase A
MFRTGVKRIAATAIRAAESAAQMEQHNAYGINVSKAQGIVQGLTGGICSLE